MQLSIFKHCPLCDQDKFVWQFHRDPTNADGCYGYCKDCFNKKRRENRERYRDSETRWKKHAAPEVLERKRDRVRVWRKNNRSKCNEYSRERDALKRGGSDGTVTDDEFKSLCERFGNICLCCKRSDVELTRDHVVPLVKGGSHTIENIQPLCRRCNSRKNDRTIDYR